MDTHYKPMAEALKQLKSELSHDVELDIGPTYGAYMLSGEHMDTFTRDVHEYFFTKYYPQKKGRINRVISNIASRVDQVLVSDLAGKLCNKLPPAFVPGYRWDYQMESAKLHIATIICHCLMDANTFPSKVEHKISPETEKWETLTYIYLGGNETKELMKGLHFEPGHATQTRVAGGKLNGFHKKRLKRLASIPFELSDVASEELIYKLFTLKADWNKRVDKDGRKLREDFNTKKDRYGSYASLIASLAGVPFYLELKYADSGRMFYRLQLEGIRPQGKLWETQMIDSAKAYHLTEDQQRALKHLIYCTVSGERVTPLEAERQFTNDLIAEILEHGIVITDDMTEDSAGELIMLYKAAVALADAREGKPTKYLFGWDFTNSGVIMAGISFHEEKMMNAGNIHSGEVVIDSHSAFGEGFGMDELSRKDIKRIHMPTLHGASLFGITRSVNQASNGHFTQSEVLQKLEDAYGPSAKNLIDIADWGVNILHNEQTRFSWSLPDGFRASHRAYFESVPMYVTVASAAEKHARSGAYRTSHTIVRDMPYAMGGDRKPLVRVPGKSPKVRGLYANITHSMDSYVLRQIVDTLLDMEMPFLLKHDDYMVHPSCYEVVLEESRKAFTKLYENNLYARAMEDIARHAKSKPPVPILVHGNAPNVISEASAYLMP